MNIKQLNALRTLVLHGSFSKAAAELEISQPALSIQIKLLEEETELQLVDRTRKPIVLTRDGEHYFEQALEILQGIDRLKDLPFQIKGEVRGHLHLGIIPTLAPYLVPFVAEEIRREHPALRLVIEEERTEDIIRGIRTGRLHAGILSTPLVARGMSFRTMFYEKFYVYISEGHPLAGSEEISLSDIRMENVWYLREGNCFSNQVNAICQLAGTLESGQGISYHTNSIESLRRIVERKHGITFIPELATLEIPPSQEDLVREIRGNPPYREISLVSTRASASNHILEAFLQTCLAQLPRHMKSRPEGWIVDTDLHIE